MSEAHEYEMCSHCWHFVEPNDSCPVEGIKLAAYVHLDDGEKEHDHDAAPSGDGRTLAAWRNAYPGLFTTFGDGKTGPNSAHFDEASGAPQTGLRQQAAEELAAEFGNDVEEWLV